MIPLFISNLINYLYTQKQTVECHRNLGDILLIWFKLDTATATAAAAAVLLAFSNTTTRID